MSRNYFLTPVLGGPGAPRYPVTNQQQLIGRSEDTDIALLEPTVSRRHATIQRDGDAIVLQDLNSKHGTFVNSKRVSTARLKDGDIVVFGLSIVLRLEVTNEALSAAKQLHVPRALSGPIGPMGTAEFENFQQSATLVAAIPSPDPHWGTGRYARQPSSFSSSTSSSDVTLRRSGLTSGADRLWTALIPHIYSRLSKVKEQLLDVPAASAAAPPPRQLEADLQYVLKGLWKLLQAAEPAPALEPTPLAGCFDQALQPVLAAQPLARVEVEIAEELMVMAIPDRLVHALQEVLLCALRLSKLATSIRATSLISSGWVWVTLRFGEAELNEAGLAELYNPFSPSELHWEKIGVGLYEARQIVMSFDGNLTLTSLRGEGSLIQLQLHRA